MKKLLFLLAAVGLIFTACEGGGDVEEENGGTPFVPEITISPKDLTFGCNGGEQAVDITANFEYEYSTSADWLTIEKSEKGISVTVPNYVDVEERTAEITISNEKYGISEVVKATQRAFVPEWTIEPESLTFTVEGGTQEIAITANFEYAYSTNADWLTIEKSEGGVKVTAQTNVEDKERTAKITISNEKYGISKVVKVAQGAFVPEITISPDELSFLVEGGEQEVAITANFEYKVSEKADWLSVEQTETGLLVKVDKSERVESRYADIVLTNKEYEVEKFISVSQAAFEPSITIKPSVITFSVNGGEQEIIITSNVEYEVSKKADWLSVEQTETGLLVTAKESKNTSERSAYISIINEKYSITKTIDIVQEAWVPKIELAQQSVEVEFEPAEYEVAVTSPYSWEATTKNDWIVVESETGIAGEEKLKFTTLRNEEEQERKGTITLKNTDYNLVAELYVTQKAFVPAITINPETMTFSVGGGTQEIAITANFEYTYSSNADWLTIKKSEKGISVTVPNYVDVEERTAEITISNEKYGVSKVVNVTQGAFVPAITIEPESLAFAVGGGTQEIAITANFEYKYSTNANWLTIEKSDKGISVTVPNYVEVEERTAEITISNEKYGISKVVKATQRAFVPAITIEPEILTFAVEGGTQEVAITANFEYEFSTNANWLTIKKGEKGINISAIQNTKLEECTAEITILNKKYNISKTISVVQKGVSAEPQNVIIYTSSDGKIVTPYKSNVFGANIVSNIYSNVHGQGIIIFDAPVTSIGERAFRNCSRLTSVTIPDSVTKIGIDAFSSCTSLTSVTIPDSVTSIGYQAFRVCDSLKAFYGKFASADNRCLIIDGVLNSFASAGLTEYTIPNSVTSIGGYAFSGCTSLTSVTIPNSVTSIGEYTFYYCSSLTSVTIGNSVTSIGSYAFSDCTSLKSVTIPDSVISIGSCAFEDCTGELIINSKKLVETNYTYSNYPMYNGWLDYSKFTKLTIGNGVTSIGNYAFYECSSLTSVTIPDGVTKIGRDAFSSCTSLTRVTIGNSVTSIGNYAFYECSSLTSITIPDSVTSIGSDAFSRCTSLISVTIPDSVTKIGEDAFGACTSLKSVYITDLSAWCKISFGYYDANPLSYRAELYLNGSVLTNITIPSDITEIKDYAFYGYSSLKSVTIPDSVTSIGKQAFFDCLRLESLYCTPATPPSINQGMFSYISTSTGINIVKPIGCKIYVPRNSVSAYKAAYGWSDYASDIVGYDF